MLFQVNMRVTIPHGEDTQKIDRLRAAEHQRAGDLAGQGKWVHVWRVAGKWANLSIFDVESPAELHAILGSLPLYPYMEIDVIALCAM